MAVLAAMILAISVGALLRGLVVARGRGAVARSRRCPPVSVIPVLFSVVMVGALTLGGLGRATSAPPRQSQPALQLPQAALDAAPVYPGPSNEAPLPRLNLPITYNYGPGPRHPVPSPARPVPDTRSMGGAGAVGSGPVGRPTAGAARTAASLPRSSRFCRRGCDRHRALPSSVGAVGTVMGGPYGYPGGASGGVCVAPPHEGSWLTRRGYKGRNEEVQER